MKRGVKLVTLQNWLYRLRREGRGGKDAPRILPVRVVASTAPTARRSDEGAGVLEIVLPSGVRLRFPMGTDGEYVAAIVKRVA
jgi:hypothetical protein